MGNKNTKKKNNNSLVHKLELKKKININIEIMQIFPNGNILIYNNENLKIYEPELFKEIFNYNISKLTNIIILSNNSLLLYNKEDTYFTILDIVQPMKIKKINIIFKYELEDKGKFVKLENNHILFYYLYINENYRRNRDEPNIYYYSYTFYIYDEKNSNLIIKYEDTQFVKFIGGFLPYKETFFYYGNDVFYHYSCRPRDYYFLYFYRNKEFEEIKENDYEYKINRIINCIICENKYLIVQHPSFLEKYQITKDKVQLISTFDFNSKKYQLDDISQIEENFFLFYSKKKAIKNLFQNTILCFI